MWVCHINERLLTYLLACLLTYLLTYCARVSERSDEAFCPSPNRLETISLWKISMEYGRRLKSVSSLLVGGTFRLSHREDR